VRTLVISDLHLGARLRRDVLRHPAAQAALLDALEGIDRLVLLGDVVELMEGRQRQALAIAEPVLRALGARLGAGREVVLVPGNHDRPLVRPWLRHNGALLTVDAAVPADSGPVLARIASWLAPAEVSVRYPGVWLSDRVWATHGHYLDRHLLPESAYGVLRRTPQDGRVSVHDYERGRRPSAARVESTLTRWLPRPLAALADDGAEWLRAATMPSVPRRLQAHRIAPLTVRVLGTQMQRASIPALARVVHRLGVDADFVIFGHVHRLGPLPEDDAVLWQAPNGGPRIVNSGAWTYEKLLLHGAGPPHAYWPGGAVYLDGAGPPRALGLLEHLDAAALGRG
jgi:UDP-2,3-diacylglucosamine pyrophosphatase LpxH